MKNGVLSNFTRSHISSDRVRSGYEIRKAREKLQCLYENIMSHNFRKAVVLKLKLRYKEFY